MSWQVAWGLYTAVMLLYVIHIARSGIPGMRKNLNGLIGDAFSRTSAGRSFGQQFVVEVFGEPKAPGWLRYSYAIGAVLMYPAFAAFLVMEGLYKGGGPAPTALEVCFVVALILEAVTVIVSVWFILQYGSTAKRVQAFFEENPRANRPIDGQPELPVWWLYGTTSREVGWNLFYGLAGIKVGVLPLVAFCLGVVDFLSARGVVHWSLGWENAVAWLIFAFWLPVGWLYVLDGAMKVAPWRGDGKFSALVLEATLYEKTQQEKNQRAVLQSDQNSSL